MAIDADLDVREVLGQVVGDRHFPVLSQVLDGLQELGEPGVVVEAQDGRGALRAPPREGHLPDVEVMQTRPRLTHSRFFSPLLE